MNKLYEELVDADIFKPDEDVHKWSKAIEDHLGKYLFDHILPMLLGDKDVAPDEVRDKIINDQAFIDALENIYQSSLSGESVGDPTGELFDASQYKIGSHERAWATALEVMLGDYMSEVIMKIFLKRGSDAWRDVLEYLSHDHEFEDAIDATYEYAQTYGGDIDEAKVDSNLFKPMPEDELPKHLKDNFRQFLRGNLIMHMIDNNILPVVLQLLELEDDLDSTGQDIMLSYFRNESKELAELVTKSYKDALKAIT